MPRPARFDRPTRLAVLTGWALVVLGLLMPVSASADELRRNGQWLPVTVVGVEAGELVYRPATGGERRIAMAEVQSLKLDSDERFFEALEAFAGEDYRAAQRLFGQVADQAEADWVRHYAWFYQAQALDFRGEPTDAAELFVEIAREGGDPYFLSKPPVRSLQEANDDQRERIRVEVMAVLEDAEGPTRQRLRNYLAVVVGEEAMPDPEPGDGGAPSVDRSGSAVILPASLWAVLEQEDAEERWASLVLLSEGKYGEALEAIAPWLNNASDMPAKLFIVGRAQLALAEASGDRDDYLDAGLSFMRLVIHYERLDSPLVQPARLEVAYIHRAIGREDLYEKLLFDQNLNLSFADDTETFPEYYRRYYEIIGEPPPSEDAEAEEPAE